MHCRLAHRMSMHNGYRPLNPNAPLCELHPSCSKLKPDDDGLLPEWIVYHEIIETSRPFLTKVSPVDGQLVEPILEKLRNVDVQRLSGGQFESESKADVPTSITADLLPQNVVGDKRRHDDVSLNAARERFLIRKSKRM